MREVKWFEFVAMALSYLSEPVNKSQLLYALSFPNNVKEKVEDNFFQFSSIVITLQKLCNLDISAL